MKTDKLISLPLAIKISDLIRLKQEFEGSKLDKSLRMNSASRY